MGAKADKLQEDYDKLKQQYETLKGSTKAVIDAQGNLRKTQHALKTVISKHNIDFDIEKADLSKLVVKDDGTIEGEFDYTPKSLKTPDGETTENKGGLTLDDIKGMNETQINENWAEVAKVLGGVA